jgi:phosphoglycolate phosphatase-like HAD superfamily hydrolase
MQTRKGIVFASDWNGTLVDDADRLWTATAKVIRSHGGPVVRRTEFLNRFCLPLDRFLGQWGLAGPELADALKEWNLQVEVLAPTAMPGVFEMVDGLRGMGIRIGVISAADERIVRSDAMQVGLAKHLDFLVGGAGSKRAALTAIRRDGFRLCYLGDTEYDVEEALAAGAIAVGFGSGYRPMEALVAAGADFVVTDLRMVPPLIRDIQTGSVRSRRG